MMKKMLNRTVKLLKKRVTESRIKLPRAKILAKLYLPICQLSDSNSTFQLYLWEF